MHRIDLNGKWSVSDRDGKYQLTGKVPGTVHHPLIEHNLIKDPYFREQELDALWVGETDWIYTRRFEISDAIIQCPRILLVAEGLDTLADITINNKVVASTDNMFRHYEFDIKSLLRRGTNEISITFRAPLPFIREKQTERPLRSVKSIDHEPDGRSYLRKEHSNFGWDWGPVLPTVGIWKPIHILGLFEGRLGAIRIFQDHRKNGSVNLDVTTVCKDCPKPGSKVRITLKRNNEIIDSDSRKVNDNCEIDFSLMVESPELWWPHGMGGQPLYTLVLDLLNPNDDLIDRKTRRIGLRTLKLIRKKDEWGESFEFAANGISFFAKGANWIPSDAIKDRIENRTYRKLLNAAVEANMNMLRIWGGGYYEDDQFYDLCDELGLCIWQDFMFACSAYPADDPAFVDNIRAEAIDQVTRLRHHSCLALWCGNNELEQGWQREDTTWPNMPGKYYSLIFDELLADVVREFDPQRDYWPSSPHTPVGDRNNFNNPDYGDAHLWDVWHGKKPFEWYRTSFHRFCSEFGFQSYPEPRTVATYTNEDDRNITRPVMEFHQRSWEGNPRIMHYMLNWFPLPNGFESSLWLSQIQQGLAIKYAVEHWRRNRPRCMGALYWQINDNWPVASWASIDYYGRWKALHYYAKRFFAPLLVCGLESEKKDESWIELHICSDLLKDTEGQLEWTLTDTAGQKIKSGSGEVSIPANTSFKVTTLELAEEVRTHSKRRLLLWIDLLEKQENGLRKTSSDLVTFLKPKHLDLEKAKIAAKIIKTGETEFEITLEADKPALCVWLNLEKDDCVCSDNFFNLAANSSTTITAKTEHAMELEDFKAQLAIKSIRDTY